MDFKMQVLEGIPNSIPVYKKYAPDINHAPKRKKILNEQEKKLAFKMLLDILNLKTMLHYFRSF